MDFRRDNRARIERSPDVDVLVIGGGVNGVAVMRDLALNGVSVVLIDRSDFCRGATSASTRMAHGGLRYLENREFKLVAESVRERNLLLKQARHVTRPLEIVVPTEALFRGFFASALRFLGFDVASAGLSVASLEAALLLYERLGRFERTLPRHRIGLGRRGRPAGLAARYKATVSYFDARITNPEGLVLDMLDEALAASVDAAALNHVEWSRDGDAFAIRDPATGWSARLRPRLVVNAAGAWIDRVNAGLGLDTEYVLPVKGAHIVVRNDRLLERLADRAFYFDDGRGRMVICCPLARTVLMGTTEIPSTDPDDRTVAPSEIDYLRGAVSRLFDDVEVRPEEIVHVTTGMRPLCNPAAGAPAGARVDAYRARRDHAAILDEPPGGGPAVVSLVGGKWTTFRAFAEQTADLVLARLGRPRRASTRTRLHPGNRPRPATNDPRTRDLRERYGAAAERAAAFCDAAPDWPLVALPDVTAREIQWLAVERGALTVEDVVLRRTRIALDGRLTRAVAREIATVLAAHLGRDAAWIEAGVEACLGEGVR